MHHVIIGNSATGIGAAEGIRAADRNARITLIGDEPHHVYSRPLISHYVAGEIARDAMRYRPAGFYERMNIAVRLGARAVSLDPDGRRVILANGETIPYDKLLLATGSLQKFPPVPGRDLAGVFDFWTQAHAEQIRARIRECHARTAVVVGAGLVGIQAAYGLRGAGLDVILIELMPSILSRILDPPAAAYAQAIFEQNGVRVLTERSVTQILGTAQDGVTRVALDNGEQIDCPLVVKATGVAPNLALVKGSPIATNVGIVVNEYFETSLADVYAAGDVAETYDVARGRPFVNANWPNAHAQGRLAGLNMAGHVTAYPGSIGMTSMPLFGKAIVSQGIVEPEPGDGVELRESPEEQYYQKLVLRQGRLVGAVMVGDIRAAGVAHHFIHSRRPIGAVKDALVQGHAAHALAWKGATAPVTATRNLLSKRRLPCKLPK